MRKKSFQFGMVLYNLIQIIVIIDLQQYFPYQIMQSKLNSWHILQDMDGAAQRVLIVRNFVIQNIFLVLMGVTILKGHIRMHQTQTIVCS